MKGANRYLTVERHDLANGSLSCFLLENHVAPPLPNPSEPQSL